MGVTTRPCEAKPPRKAPLPSDPPPPLAAQAKKTRGIEARLRGNRAYQRTLKGPLDDKLKLLLTAVSTMLLRDEVPEEMTGSLRDSGLDSAARDLHAIYSRVGRYPKPFSKRVERIIKGKGAARPGRQGVWSKSGTHDFAALAAWLKKRRPEFLRSLIKARRSGVGDWNGVSDNGPHRLAYLAHEQQALERIRQLTKLTSAERKRLEALKSPVLSFGDEVSVGPLVYVVSGVETTNSLGFALSQFDAVEGKHFVVVRCSVENRSSKRVSVNLGTFRLIDGGQKRYKPSVRAAGALALAEDGYEVILSEADPGETYQLAMPFELPEDRPDKRFTLNLPGPKGAKGAKVTFEMPNDDEEPSTLRPALEATIDAQAALIKHLTRNYVEPDLQEGCMAQTFGEVPGSAARNRANSVFQGLHGRGYDCDRHDGVDGRRGIRVPRRVQPTQVA